MRLSDVRGERTLDVIADIIGPVANIAGDEDMRELFSRKPCPEGMTPTEFMLGRVSENLPSVLRSHKSDIIGVLAAIGGTTPEEYADGMDMVTLLRDVLELVNDKVFVDFLASLQQTSGAAGSQSGTTEARAAQTPSSDT